MLILAGDAAALHRAVAGVRGPLRWLALADGKAATEARVLLRGRDDAEEVDRGALNVSRRAAFRDRYVAFMARVNAANHSRFWWAMPFTTKNPLATPLCRDVFDFLAVADLVEHDARPLAVLVERPDLARALTRWARSAGVAVVRREGWRRRWRHAVRRRVPALLLVATAQAIGAWRRARRRPVPARTHAGVGLFTLMHPHTFGGPVPRDVYFGRLPALLAKRGIDGLVFGFAIERRGEGVVEAIGRAPSPMPVMAIEGVLTVRELLAWLAHAAVRVVRPFRVAGAAQIGGRDVRELVQGAAWAAVRDGGFFRHLGLYYMGRAVARRFVLDRLIYPYENRAFEKMLLQGVRGVRPDVRLIGYNHAAITNSHTNFLFGDGEAKITPLPDALLTLGPVVKAWLDAEGHYPPGMVHAACGLRQDLDTASSPRPRRRPLRDVLVTLATSMAEYVTVLRLLEAAMPLGDGVRVRVRPHPSLRLADALRVAGLARPDFFEVDDMPLAESLRQADAVLYASSTVGVEAVALGVPAIYVDVQDFLDTDPMFGWHELKWEVRRAEELAPILAAIAQVDDQEFANRQRQGRAYAERYFGRVDDRAVQVFLDA